MMRAYTGMCKEKEVQLKIVNDEAKDHSFPFLEFVSVTLTLVVGKLMA